MKWKILGENRNDFSAVRVLIHCLGLLPGELRLSSESNKKIYAGIQLFSCPEKKI